jgi:hypothetical protein
MVQHRLKEEAFSSPCMMWPVDAFYDGSNALAEEELTLAQAFRDRGRGDLASYVLDGRRVQRLLFAFGPGGASHQDTKTFASLFIGLRRALIGSDEAEGENEEPWEAWRVKALIKWRHEDLLQTVSRSQQRP